MIAMRRIRCVENRCLVLLAILALLCLTGCKRKETAPFRPPVQAISSPEITAALNAMTKGMTPITFDKLAGIPLGRRCVVIARTPERADPPPPPLGMVRIMGATTVYAGELHEVSSSSLKIRAAYPTSGNLKIIDIPRADIQSIHIGG